MRNLTSRPHPDHRSVPMPDRRRWLLALPSGALLASPLAMVGCGGGGGSGAAPGASTVTVTLGLPAALADKDLTLVSSGGEAAVQGRSATVTMTDASPALLTAVHSSDRVVAMGMLGGSGASRTLDARSSAEALLFMALGGSQLQAADRTALVNLLRQEPQAAALADAIAARWSVDPFALDEPDPTIAAAVQAALAAMRSVSAAAAQVGRRVRRLAASADTVQPLQRIEPGDAVAGVTTLQADGTDGAPGIKLQNTRRRRGLGHVYKVSYTPTGGSPFDLALADPLYERIEVGATQQLTGSDFISAFTGGSAPWAPVETARYGMPMHPGAELTKYEMVYLTPVYDRPEPDFFLEVRYSLLRNVWREELAELFTATQMELVYRFTLEAFGFSTSVLTDVALTAAIAAVKVDATTDVIVLLEQAGLGQHLIAGTRQWLQRLTSGSINIVGQDMQRSVATVVRPADARFADNIAAGNLSRARRASFRGALRIMLAVYVVAGVFDTGALYIDLHNGEKGHLVTSTLVAPKVLISPSSGNISRGAQMPLTARVTGAQNLTLSFHWALTGSNLANLSDTAGHLGASFDSDLDTVTLATTPSTQGTLTITVEAFSVKSDGSKVSLGTAIASLLVDATVVKISPARAEIERTGGARTFTVVIDPPPAPGTLVQYEWRCLSQYGTLESGGATTNPTAVAIVGPTHTATYTGRSNNDGGTFETIEVQAFHLDGEGARRDIGSKGTAEVFIKQQYNLLLTPGDCELPLNLAVPLLASTKEALPPGATVQWTWTHGGVGVFTPPAASNTNPSQATLATGATEGLATITVQAVISVPGQPDFRPLPVTRALNVKRDVRTVSFASGWIYEAVWGDPFTFFGCGTESNPVGLCRPYTLYFYAVIPKVPGAKSVSMTLDRPSADPLGAITFPSTYSAASGWVDRGGYWVQNLSSVGGTAGENGVQPGAHIATETARFGPMTVTVNVTL